MSAAFLRLPPIFWGMSMSSTPWRVSMRRSLSKYDQSAYARRTIARPRSAMASATLAKSKLSPRLSRAPMARFS
jgi:hypothetical protein